MEYNADDLLPPFLRNLADKIENKRLTDKQMQQVGEFFMSYLFEEQVNLDDKTDKDFKKIALKGTVNLIR